jgi:5-methylthioadenosine/S-adenosylhomocysteine deaminase
MDALTVMRMATIEGAKALGLSHITGSIEKGKRADIIVVDTNKPHLTPIYNPYSVLVYSARGNDVRHSMINGRLVMEDRVLKTMDLNEIMDKAAEKAAGVRKRVH